MSPRSVRSPGDNRQAELQETRVSTISRNNIHQSGRGTKAMMFAHGFGCDQNMWRFVAPAFEADFRTILFDHVGAGRSDLAAYDPKKYCVARRLRRRRRGDRPGAGSQGRGVRRAFGQRHDRCAGLDQGAGDVRGSGHGRSIATLHRRRRATAAASARRRSRNC